MAVLRTKTTALNIQAVEKETGIEISGPQRNKIRNGEMDDET